MSPLDLALVVVASVLGHAIYDLVHAQLVASWRGRRMARALARRFAEFKAHLAGHVGVCPICQTPLREHVASQNDLGCFAICPTRIAGPEPPPALGRAARPVN